MQNNNYIFKDENEQVQFDFSNAIDVFEPHELANMYSEYLSDVDFVVEDKEKLICLEYKNSNVKNASNPQAFQNKITQETFCNKMAKKFYGTMFLVWACNKNQANKPVQYVFLMETNPEIDNALKKRLISKLTSRLPFKYKNENEVHRHVIDEFHLVNLDEWKEMYPQYSIEYIE